MRPRRLPNTPPVEVAAATWPRPSQATAPTVPSAGRDVAQRRRVPSVTSASGGQRGTPCRRASATAASPTRSTSRPSAITARARRIGFGTPATAPTAPAPSVSPVMSEASISTPPSAVRVEPSPALKDGSSSSTTTASTTASSAPPPRVRTLHPASVARATPARRGARSAGLSPPAPPWTTIALTARRLPSPGRDPARCRPRPRSRGTGGCGAPHVSPQVKPSDGWTIGKAAARLQPPVRRPNEIHSRKELR